MADDFNGVMRILMEQTDLQGKRHGELIEKVQETKSALGERIKAVEVKVETAAELERPCPELRNLKEDFDRHDARERAATETQKMNAIPSQERDLIGVIKSLVKIIAWLTIGAGTLGVAQHAMSGGEAPKVADASKVEAKKP